MPLTFNEDDKKWNINNVTNEELRQLLAMGISFLSGIVVVREALDKVSGGRFSPAPSEEPTEISGDLRNLPDFLFHKDFK